MTINAARRTVLAGLAAAGAAGLADPFGLVRASAAPAPAPALRGAAAGATDAIWCHIPQSIFLARGESPLFLMARAARRG
jgi:hypothetical protein